MAQKYRSTAPPSGAPPLLGAHMSIAGGTPRAIDRGLQVGCTALQIFVKNNNRWKGRVITEEEGLEFRRRWKQSSIAQIVAHDCYLINLASPDRTLWRRSLEALGDEMERCRRLGIRHLVTHPGSHVGSGERQGIARVAEAIDELHQRESARQVHLVLETTAGQGTSLGHRFQHLRDILARCRHPDRVFVCFDTCHVFAAGYDIRAEEAYRKTMGKFQRTVGLDKLRLFHFNDSKRELGSRVDRHHHIGQGKIGGAGFGWILNDPRFARIPKILETPKGKTYREDRRNLRILRSLIRF